MGVDGASHVCYHILKTRMNAHLYAGKGIETMNTEDLTNALKKTVDFDRLCERRAQDFTDEDLIGYLAQMLKKYGVSKHEMIEKADLEKGYAYQILRGVRKPSRDKLLQIALGLGCDLSETQRLLRLGGRNELYSRVRRDAAIIFCIQKHDGLDDCQCFLEGHRLETLKE